MKNDALLYKIRLFLILGLAIFVQLFNFSQKEVYHIDELFSYGLANGENGVYLFKDASEIDNKLLKKDFFINYLTQTQNSTYAKMWNNLKYDNHMPLYFVLLHTISNFFSTGFTSYPGIILNVIILLTLLISLYKLAIFVFNDKEIALVTISLFMLTESIMFLSIFIRMYLLQILSSTMLFYMVLRFMLNDKENTLKMLLIICILSSLTILTHYYSIIYCFILTLTGSIILLKQKRYKKIFKYALAMLISVVISYFIYPEMLTVGTKGERGGQLVLLLSQYIKEPLKILSNQLPLFINTFFINNYIAIMLLSISLILVFLSKTVLDENKREILIMSYLTFIGYGFISSLIMPNMTTYQIRYFAPILSIGTILIIYFGFVFIKLIKAKPFKLYIFLWLIVGINGYYIINYPNRAFYLRGNDKYKRTENIVKDAEIWWALGGGNQYSWIIHNYLDKLALADKVWTLVDFDNEEFLNLAQKGKENKKYAYLFMPKTQEQIPEGAEEWINKATNRQGYYMYTIKSDKTAAMTFEASIYLVCPY